MIAFVIVISIVLAFILSGVESALLTISRVRVRHSAEAGDKSAARLLVLLEHRVELLHTVTALNHCFTLLAYLLSVRELVRHLDGWGWLAAVVVLTPLFLVLLELLPKQLFYRYPLGVLRLLTKPLKLLLTIARPWLSLGNLFQSRVLNDVPEEGDQRSMASLAKTVESLCVLRPLVGSMLHKAGRLQEVCAQDAMMPLKQVTALFPEMAVTSALVLCREQNHSWRPVMGTNGALLGWLDVAALPPASSPTRWCASSCAPFPR
ncbi:CNNM domain-containing protein [Verrucomicrobium spinosum]|uniref:CNNM domain-containing protein n=1 Tax=Verrucomicrobium spinosum TaxID=2736 RepID=UPI000946376A|nr:CNNM domain-containing protein [Verrucomicrobium spinosum]